MWGKDSHNLAGAKFSHRLLQKLKVNTRVKQHESKERVAPRSANAISTLKRCFVVAFNEKEVQIVAQKFLTAATKTQRRLRNSKGISVCGAALEDKGDNDIPCKYRERSVNTWKMFCCRERTSNRRPKVTDANNKRAKNTRKSKIKGISVCEH